MTSKMHSIPIKPSAIYSPSREIPSQKNHFRGAVYSIPCKDCDKDYPAYVKINFRLMVNHCVFAISVDRKHSATC